MNAREPSQGRVHNGHFRNVDLDVSSPLPVDRLVEALSPTMFALHVEQVGDRHVARLELHDFPDGKDDGLRRILDALGGLEGAALEVLANADVVLSIGVDAKGPNETTVRVAPALLADAGRLGVAVEVVVYRASE